MLAGLVGCWAHSDSQATAIPPVSAIRAVDLSVPARVGFLDEGIHISLAKNAWSEFVVQLDGQKLSGHSTLRLPQLSGISFSAFQVLSVPVNLNDAEYVRQTGEPGLVASVPRVLLPLPISNGSVDLSALNKSARPILIWVDLHTAESAAAGKFTGQCVLADGPSAWNLPVEIAVENLTLPAQPHLHFSAPLDWSALAALYPETFEAVAPRLLNRGDPRRARLLQMIDDYLQLAHENKIDFYVPRLQPIVKWPLGKLPDVDWTDFDSVAAPWLTGSAFGDHEPIAFWPLPAPDSFADFDLAAQVQYWQLAAEHFSQMHWIERSPIVLKNESEGPANSILLSAEVGRILLAHPKITMLLPLRDDQVQFSTLNSVGTISTDRLIDLAPEFAHFAGGFNGISRQKHWIDATGNVAAVASEQATRSIAWNAFSQSLSLVLCGNPIAGTDQSAKADQMILAYPGEPFGLNHPLPTVQLKWMRQAEQDYEYLLPAAHGNPTAMKICRLETRPVQLGSQQSAEPLFSLFAGNTDPHGCEEARQLLVEQLSDKHASTSAIDPADLQAIRWFAAREKQKLVPNGVDWMWDGNAIAAALNLDVFNPAGEMPDGGEVQWAEIADGWTAPAEPAHVAAVGQFQVKPVTTSTRFDLNKITAASRVPMTLNFMDNFTRQTAVCKLILPVAVSERRQRSITLDGSLDDWFPADAIQLNQPLVKMLDRPAVQSGTLKLSQTPTSIYTGWSDDHFYLAFRLGGVTTADLRSTRNFVQYDHGRAWGEDLCELLVQPIYIDNSKGPLLHVVCKPGGSWVEQQVDGKSWTPFEACGLRYASGVDSAEKVWRGEVAIPWKAIDAAGHGRPALLRFNFLQHQQANAESASWAGPIDQSRDGKLMGLLFLKEP